ncbi:MULTISPECIES: hypothetical protein [unclassified Xanthomonas]|uniref:hypothetical protein n=1 Tax=unclassified Xanthomonas TaxID=2643310 RepID=UPI0028833494|nr:MULTISPECIES: hypothetical protein [unclassified Xanthomonas]
MGDPSLMGGGEKEQASTPGTGASALGSGVLSGDNNGQVIYAGKSDYAAKHLPRFETMPWTAEVFDQRPVAADPQVFCMSSVPTASDPREASCTCLTEQGTRYDLPQPMCRTLARNGAPHNPYKDVRQQQRNNSSRRKPGRWVIRISLCSSQDLSLQGAHVTSAPSPSRSLTLLLLAFLRPRLICRPSAGIVRQLHPAV